MMSSDDLNDELIHMFRHPSYTNDTFPTSTSAKLSKCSDSVTRECFKQALVAVFS